MINQGFRRVFLIILTGGIIGGLLWLLPAVVSAMPPLQFSPTPVQVVLPTSNPTEAVLVTPTPTRTPTPEGPALAEALDGPTNVRSGPDVSEERLGQIMPGEFYPIIGKTALTQWYKIQYADTPGGVAWVYGQVVNITGDIENIPEIEVSTQPTVDVNSAVATQTIEALAQTPGALETATAVAFIAGVVIEDVTLAPSETSGPLPTFTAPAEPISRSTAIAPFGNQPVVTGGGLPPIIPIVALGALGVLGFFIAFLRQVI